MIASSRTRPHDGRRSLGFLIIVCLLFAASPGAFAATLTVSTLLDTDDAAAAGECTLREAIANANDNATTNADCPADGAYGDDLIQFDQSLFAEVDDDPDVDDDNRNLELTERAELMISDAGGTGTLTIEGEIANPDDPDDTVTVTIDALGNTAGTSNFVCAEDVPIRLFNLRSPTTLNNLNLTGGCATPPNTPQGGAILIGNNAPLTLNDVNITNSLALDDAAEAGAGGGIFVSSGSTLVMNDGSLRANTAGARGGAIANESTALIGGAGSCPLGTEAPFSGDCTIALENTTIAGNIVGDTSPGDTIFGRGGGLHNGVGATVAGRVVTFDGNSASADGGGIWNASGGGLELLSATLQNNRARALDDSVPSDPRGGAAIFNDGGTLTIEFATFRSNGVLRGDVLDTEAVTVHGGAIASTGGDLVFDTVAMTGNAAGQREVQNDDDEVLQQLIPGLGGALYIEAGSLTIMDSTLFSNTAQSDGGAIWHASTNLDMQRVTVQSNEARGGDEDATVVTGGGGLYNDGPATIVDSRFYSNVANGENSAGGGILHISGVLEVTDTEIGRNDATFGGGVDNGGTLNLTRVFLGAPQTESRNIAGEEGGGLHNRAGASATIDDSTIAFNDGNDGGGIWNAGTLNVTNSTFSRNRALSGGSGGALFQADTGSADLRFATVANNSADGSGAGVALADGGTPVTIESSIVGDAADGSVSDDPDRSLVNQSGMNLDGLKLFGGPLPTRPLRADSPAVDFVASGSCNENLDQRGASRPFDGDEDSTADCDTGSFERTDAAVLSVGRNGPQDVVVGLREDDVQPGEKLVVLAFSLTNNGDAGVNVGGFRARPLFNGGVEALRRLVDNDPDAALDFEAFRDVNGNGEFDADEEVKLGDDGTNDEDFARQFTFTTSGDVNIPAGETDNFLVAVTVPDDADQSAVLFSMQPILAGGALIGLLGLVRIRGLRRRAQWLMLVGLMTAGLAACSDSTSIDDIQPPRPPQPDPSLQGQLRFELRELTPGAGEGNLLVGDGLPVFGPRIGVR